MPLVFTTTGAAACKQGIKVLTHGRSGVGKTKLIGTAPRPIIMSAERGTLVLASMNLPVLLITSPADLDDAYRWATTSHEARGYDTFALDSLSEMAEAFLYGAKLGVKDPRQAYGAMADWVAVQTRLWRDITGPQHVYFTAKSELEKQPDGTTMYAPSLPGQKAGPGLAYFFDEFLYMGVGRTPDGVDYRYLQTGADLQVVAKDRSGMLDKIEEPNLTKIFTKIAKAYSAPALPPLPPALPVVPKAPPPPPPPLPR